MSFLGIFSSKQSLLATSERFLPAEATVKIHLANENHWLQPMLVLTVRWWPTPVSVGGLSSPDVGSGLAPPSTISGIASLAAASVPTTWKHPRPLP